MSMKRRARYMNAASLLTLLNLVLGIGALLLALLGRPGAATAFVTLGLLCDFLDGRVARATRTASEFGKELDSLADIVTFGVAPSVIVNVLVVSPFLLAGALVYGAAAGFRLARFTVLQGGPVGPRGFVGLPVPAAAVLLLVITFIMPAVGVLLAAQLLFAALMVSTLRFPKL